MTEAVIGLAVLAAAQVAVIAVLVLKLRASRRPRAISTSAFFTADDVGKRISGLGIPEPGSPMAEMQRGIEQFGRRITDAFTKAPAHDESPSPG